MRRSPSIIPLAVVVLAAAGCSAASPGAAPSPPPAPASPDAALPRAEEGLRFEVSLAPAAEAAIGELGLETPVHGRAYVLVSRDTVREPRHQVGVAGVPLWGVDVEGLMGGGSVVIGDGDPVRGYPFRRLAELPAGEYQVQAFLNVYTTFHRADGHVVRLHQDAGDGQDPWVSPGNAHSKVRRMRLDPAAGGTIRLTLSEVIPPIDPVPPGGTMQQGNPTDTEQVKHVKIRSELLSRFWGRDMYIGANVLLPRDYDARSDKRYATLYHLGHFPGGRAPFGFGAGARNRGRGEGFDEFWMSPAAPDLVVVTIRDANPYYDTSYSVNSANVGPYGDAIRTELIPYLEREFRLDPSPEARVLAGGSTGGWEALALQIFYPNDFAGAWGWCPDAVDFHHYQIVDIYGDDNAYVLDRGWLEVERPGMRRADGLMLYTMRDENHLELAVGSHSRSGGQWAIWEAVYGPVGDDGYPARIWDPVTGEIDRAVAEYWRANYDLTEHLRRHWPEIGARLAGRLHVSVGDMDNFYLELAVYRMQALLESMTDPVADATFEYGRRQPHCWIGHSRERPGEEMSNAEFVRLVSRYLEAVGQGK